jgi:nitric oxide synthase oxygenase domain/subunit
MSVQTQDSVYVLAHALKEMMMNETITEAPKDCDDSGVFWETGKRLFHYLKSRNINGKTGRLVSAERDGNSANCCHLSLLISVYVYSLSLNNHLVYQTTTIMAGL